MAAMAPSWNFTNISSSSENRIELKLETLREGKIQLDSFIVLILCRSSWAQILVDIPKTLQKKKKKKKMVVTVLRMELSIMMIELQLVGPVSE